MPRYPLWKALAYILCSVLLVTGPLFGLWIYYSRNRAWSRQNPANNLTRIVQAPKPQVADGFFEELFDLSVDQPTNCYLFCTKKATKKLRDLPAVTRGKVKVLPPNTLYIDYELRQPVAYLGNQTNTLIDAEGKLFPSDVFYSPKRLPEWFFDLNSADELSLALKLSELLRSDEIALKRIDLTHYASSNWGKREVVLLLEHAGRDHYLRLPSDNWQAGVERYLSLLPRLDRGCIVDLRFPKMALVKEYGETAHQTTHFP